MRSQLFVVFVLVSAVLLSSSLFAQTAEINPYAAFYWPGDTSSFGSFQNNQLIGVRGGYYITPGFEIGGNYSWSNHFQPKDTEVAASFAGDLGFPQGKVRANIWEAEFSYNFGKRSLMGSAQVKPYVVLGLGGLTTSTKNPSTFVLSTRPVFTPVGTVFVAKDVLDSSNTFFALSYGGGVKAERLWGPVGVFGDIRGRTVPNFFSSAFNWPELSAGLTFSWGER